MPRLSVPIHSLGISQIISYGLLFYVFAQLKTPLAELLNAAESDVLMAVSGALVMQAVLAPIIGGWVDRFGALFVLSRGLAIGAVGMALLPLVSGLPWLWCCMIVIGVGFAMASYESAVAGAVQLDEKRSRRNISYITFYGGVASSISWLTIAPLYLATNLMTTCLVISGVLLAMAARIYILEGVYGEPPHSQKKLSPPAFSWRILGRHEKLAIITLALSSSLEYLVFASTTLLWINWFALMFNDWTLAVILASIYGPFQVVGRVIEMTLGHRFDARKTGILAFLCVPAAMLLAQVPSVPIAILCMAIFGIGHGILTVTYGFVTNMYFRADVYGRAKGWIVLPRGFGTAFGPSLGGVLFVLSTDLFFGVMIAVSIISGLAFTILLLVTPTNDQVT